MRIVKDGRGEWKTGVSRKSLEPWEFPLTLLGTGAVESGCSVGKLQQIQQSLFRGELPGFVNLLLGQHIAKLTGSSRSIPSGR
jgi:hypothetical protein